MAPLNLTANLEDFTGTAEGEGSLIIALCNFGSVIPRIAGTSLIADAGPEKYEATAGVVTTKVWGNDAITPQGTYYCIEVADENGDVVQCSLYQFGGTADIDLADAPPIDPNIGVPPFQFATTDVFIILPSFTQDREAFTTLVSRLIDAGIVTPPPAGVSPASVLSYSAPPGNTYTLTYSPYLGILLGLYYNGNLLIPGLHYSLSGKVITLSFNTGIGDNLCAVYVGT